MLNVRIIAVGKMKFYTDAAKEYEKRLNGSVKLEIREIPEYRLPVEPSDADIVNALSQESAQILKNLPERAFVFAMCIEGKMLSSEELAEVFADIPLRGISQVCFVIGGSFGLHDSVKSRADMRLSMSRMTFPHHLARVMLLEQIYRVATINSGLRYHK